MRKSESNKISNAQLAEWSERNRDPGVLPCVPAILINQLCGEKTGIVMNFRSNLTLVDMAAMLQAALSQVEMKVRELEEN